MNCPFCEEQLGEKAVLCHSCGAHEHAPVDTIFFTFKDGWAKSNIVAGPHPSDSLKPAMIIYFESRDTEQWRKQTAEAEELGFTPWIASEPQPGSDASRRSLYYREL